jgi:hypothetical protein
MRTSIQGVAFDAMDIVTFGHWYSDELNLDYITVTRTEGGKLVTRRIKDFTIAEEHSKDLVFIRVRGTQAFKNMFHHFHSEEFEDPGHIALVHFYGLDPNPQRVILGTLVDHGAVQRAEFNHLQMDSANGIVYDMSFSYSGYCGTIVLGSGRGGRCRIVGIHVGAFPDRPFGLGARVTQETIAEYRAAMGPEQTAAIVPQFCDDTTLNALIGAEGTALVRSSKCFTFGIEEASDFCEQTDKPIEAYVTNGANLARKTSLKQTPYHDTFPLTERPAYLRPHMINGEMVDPAVEVIRKHRYMRSVDTDTDMGPALRQLLIYYDVIHTRGGCRVLSWESAYNGDEDESLVPLNMSTSPGYPYKGPGKSRIINVTQLDNGRNFLEPTDQFEVDVRAHMAFLRNGLRGYSLYTLALKDETRKLSKIDKTRGILTASAPLVIIGRKAFGSFIGQCKKLSVALAPFAPGMNVHGLDWSLLGGRLSGNSMLMCGDFKSFDTTISNRFAGAFSSFVNTFYPDDEWSQIRDLLVQEITDATFLFGNACYRTSGSNPSGNILTTIYNCFVCYVVIYTSIHHIMEQEGLLHAMKDLFLYVYGDDNVIAMPEVHFEPARLTHVVKELFDMELLNFDKSGALKLLDIGQVTFLGRSIKFSHGRWLAPLDLDVIQNIMMWTHSYEPQFVQSLINAVCYELTHHDAETYNRVTGLIRAHPFTQRLGLIVWSRHVALVKRWDVVYL